jgi:predicted acylesterase/phospholipase RssA
VTDHNELADTQAALVLAGGIGLGAYQAGAYEALHREGRLSLKWLAGSSVGAVNAALIAGSRAGDRIETLRRFWNDGDLWSPLSPAGEWSGELRHLQNWFSAVRTRLFGAAGHFRPRLSLNPMKRFESLYDLTPMRTRLEKLVDFGRLNDGSMRMSIAATDIETGELVVFDTGEGAHIDIEHLLASCGYLPEFAPVEIDGRLLGDGGLYATAPVEIVVDEWTQGPILVLRPVCKRWKPAHQPGGCARKTQRSHVRQPDRSVSERLLRDRASWRRADPVLQLSRIGRRSGTGENVRHVSSDDHRSLESRHARYG